MSNRRNRRIREASRRKIAKRQVLVVHESDCGCSCVTCGVEFDAGDVSVEVPYVLN